MKKGFTLIELLASIIIIGLLLIITIPSYIYIYNSSKQTAYNNKINSLKINSLRYAEKIKDEVQADICINVQIKELIKKGYIKSDYKTKDALENPYTKNELEENLSVCYCKSDNELKAFYADQFVNTKSYVKGDQVKYNDKIYECMSSYSYNGILADMENNKDKKTSDGYDETGKERFKNADCQGYYNGEINLCISNGTSLTSDYLINHFFKLVEC